MGCLGVVGAQGGDAGPRSILWGWELDFAFPPGDGGQDLASLWETCALRQPQ